MCKLKYIKFILGKAIIFSIIAFFIFYGLSFAAVATSKTYKLHASYVDGGGVATTSTTYSSDSSVAGPVGTYAASSSGGNYKSQGGSLPTLNILPSVSIASHNDGSMVLDLNPTLKWSYSDKDGNVQKYYQVQVSLDNFVTSAADSGVVSSTSTTYTTPSLKGKGATYKWRVRVNDGFDYSGWATASSGFRVGTAAMEVPIIWARVSPTGEDIPEQLWQKWGAPYMYWEYPVTGIEVAGYSYAWGGIPDDEIDTKGASYQTPDDLLEDGVKVFNLKTQNTAGEWGEVASYEIWIDRKIPVLGVYSPTNGTIIATDTPTITIGVTDEHSGVNPEGLTIKVNNASVEATYDEGQKSVIYIPSIPLSEGDIVVSSEVKDMVGNTTIPLVWSFIVDTVGPEHGSIIINNEDAVTNSVYVGLTLSAKDSTTGVDKMSISNDGVFDTEPWEPFSTKKENWMLSAINGTRKVYVTFKDKAGNVSEIFTDTIELVILAPDTIITSGPSGLTKSKAALFTFRSNTGGCVFRWKFDDEEWTDWSSEISVKKENLSDGNHYFKVQAAKDVNNNKKIDLDEIDPTPEERTWTISETGEVKPELPEKKPYWFWKEE